MNINEKQYCVFEGTVSRYQAGICNTSFKVESIGELITILNSVKNNVSYNGTVSIISYDELNIEIKRKLIGVFSDNVFKKIVDEKIEEQKVTDVITIKSIVVDKKCK